MPRAHSSTPPSPPLARWWERQWCLRALLCGIALLAYANSFRTEPVLDMRALLAQDTRIRQVSAENLNLIVSRDYWWPASRGGNYRPLTTASFLFNYAVLGNGGEAEGYHWINFLLHAGNVCLLFALAGRILGRRWPAFFAAAVWAVHPLGTEAVTNLVGRADEMAAMAVMGGLLLHVELAGLRGRRYAAALAALLATAVAGMFAKENAIVLPAILLLWDLSFGRDVPRDRLRRLLPYAVTLAAAGLLWWARARALALISWPSVNVLENPVAMGGFWMGRLTAIKVIGLDLWLMVCPWQLSADRSFNQIPVAAAGDVAAWVSLGVLAGVLGAAVWRWRRDRLTFWLAGFLGLTLLPTANLLFPIGSIMAERFLYLPSAAFAIGAAALVFRLKDQRIAMVLLSVVIAIFGARTLARNADWQDSLTLFAYDVESAPGSFKVHDFLGRWLIERDPKANLDRAIAEAETACAILRRLPPAMRTDQTFSYLGMYLGLKADALRAAGDSGSQLQYQHAVAVLREGREAGEAAAAEYDRLQLEHHRPLVQRMGYQDLYLYLGAALSGLGRREEALEAFRTGRNLNPFTLEFYDGLAGAQVAAGNPGAAAVAMDEKALLDGMQQRTVTALQQLYVTIPGGGCAVTNRGGIPALEPACPKLREDMCAAAADLQQAFVWARWPQKARPMAETAVSRYGCSAALLDTAR